MKLQKPNGLEEIQTHDKTAKPILCVHGLNQQPTALKPLLKDLCDLGFSPYLLHMPGHNDQTNYKSLRPETFHESYKKAYEYIHNKHQRKPYFFGYSFGGLMGVCNYEQMPFEKMVLLAPALKLRSYTFLLKPALPFLSKIKSISLGDDKYEQRYRYHDGGVPVEVYHCFFSIYEENIRKSQKSLKDSDALVFTHPKDELISYKRLARWVNKNTQWKSRSIDNQRATYSKYNHLCFDKTTLGESSYRSLLADIKEFLVSNDRDRSN